MFHIFKWEFKSQLKSLIIWSLIFIIFISMMTTEFSAYYDNPEMLDVMSLMPEQLLKAFSMNNANLTTPEGYMSIASAYFGLMFGLYAVLLGSAIISKEERDKTAEYLMTMPVSREKIILAKFITALLCTVILLIVFTITVFACMIPFEITESYVDFVLLMVLSMFLISLFFLGIGMLLASILKRYKSSGKISAITIMVLYFISMLVSLSDKIENLKYITPFKYFEANVYLHQGHLEIKYVFITLIVFACGIIGTFIVYPRRDLHI